MGISIAAGQNTTLFLAKSNEKFSDMPRHPEQVDAPSYCVKCNRDNGEDDSPLECDKVCSAFPDCCCILTFGNKCDSPWHLKCLDPPLDAVPDGEWFCPDCEEDPGAAVGAWATAKKSKSKAKAKRPASPSEPEAGVKRKAPPKTKTAGTLPLGLFILSDC